MGSAPMLEQIEPLPCPEHRPSGRHGNADLGFGQCEFSLKTGQIERWILDFSPKIFLE